MAIKQVGIATLNPGAPDQSWGKCRNFEVANEAEKEALMDGEGNTVGLIFSDIKTKCSGEFIPLASGGTTLTESDLIGRKLDISMHGGGGGYSVVVESASMSYEAGKSAKFKFEGYCYPQLKDGESGGN